MEDVDINMFNRDNSFEDFELKIPENIDLDIFMGNTLERSSVSRNS